MHSFNRNTLSTWFLIDSATKLCFSNKASQFLTVDMCLRRLRFISSAYCSGITLCVAYLTNWYFKDRKYVGSFFSLGMIVPNVSYRISERGFSEVPLKMLEQLLGRSFMNFGCFKFRLEEWWRYLICYLIRRPEHIQLHIQIDMLILMLLNVLRYVRGLYWRRIYLDYGVLWLTWHVKTFIRSLHMRVLLDR